MTTKTTIEKPEAASSSVHELLEKRHRELRRAAWTSQWNVKAMSEETTIPAFGGGGLAMLRRIIKIIDYSLNDQETDELTLEVSMKGAAMQEDERTDLDDDENPGGLFNEQYLGDDVTMDEATFSTTYERCGWDSETITRSDLEALRASLDSLVKAND